MCAGHSTTLKNKDLSLFKGSLMKQDQATATVGNIELFRNLDNSVLWFLHQLYHVILNQEKQLQAIILPSLVAGVSIHQI